MKKKIGTIIAISTMTLGVFASVSMAIANEHKQHLLEAKADGTTYTLIGGHNYWASTDIGDVILTDDDGDGVFSTTMAFQANDEWIIRQDYDWNKKWARGCLASYPTSSFWGTGEGEGGSNIHVAKAGTYRVDFTPSLGSIEVWNPSNIPSFKTFHLLVPSSWSDWSNNVRVHWWGNSSYESNFRAGKEFVNTSKSYTTGGVSGTLYTAKMPSDVTGIKVAKNDISAETSNLAVSGNNDIYAYLSYNVTNNLTVFDYIADGGYIRGKYHGTVNWDTNVVLASEDEYVTYDYDKKQFHARLELYAGDYFHFYEYYAGVQYVRAIYSKESADDTYYPIEWDDNNVKVTNAGVYIVTAGQGDGAHSGDEWYYLDNTASAFATEFLDSMTCYSSGAEPSWDTGYSWKYFADYYKDNLDDYAKNTFYRATSNPSGTNIENAVARHDVIVASHGYTPFIANSSGTLRNAVKIQPLLIVGGETLNSGLSLVVIASSLITMIAVGGYFLLRKKRI